MTKRSIKDRQIKNLKKKNEPNRFAVVKHIPDQFITKSELRQIHCVHRTMILSEFLLDNRLQNNRDIKNLYHNVFIPKYIIENPLSRLIFLPILAALFKCQ